MNKNNDVKNSVTNIRKMNINAKEGNIYMVPLGGCSTHGIGMNMTLYICKTNDSSDVHGQKNQTEAPKNIKDLNENYQFIIVDTGITFGEKGREIVMPDVTAIKDLMHLCQGIIITHAHLDHVGSVAYLYKILGSPTIYTTPFTSKIVESTMHKFYGKSFNNSKIKVISNYSQFRAGIFELNFHPMEHSIPDANSLFIKTRYGNIFHSGDWKGTVRDLEEHEIMDTNKEITPDMIDVKMDYKKISEISKDTLAIVCDSTKAMSEDPSKSEDEVYQELLKHIDSVKSTKGMIFVSCFSSNVKRVISIIKAAVKNERTPILLGRSMEEFTKQAKAEGYLAEEFAKKVIFNPRKAVLPARNKRLVICTGSQGEENAAIHRMAHGTHDLFKMDSSDFVIFSSKTIPGNERKVEYILSVLTLKKIPYEFGSHASGHPGQKELAAMYKAVNPKYVIPVHGSSVQIEAHKKYAEKCGYKAVAPHNGDLIEISKNGIRKFENAVFSGRSILNGRGIAPADDVIFKARDRMNEHGAIYLSVLISKKTNKVLSHKFSQHGVNSKNNRIMINLKSALKGDLQKITTGVQGKVLEMNHEFLSQVESDIRVMIRNFVEKNLSKSPLIDVHAMFV